MRTAYVVAAGITLLLVTVQFVLAGLLLFNDRDFVDAHGGVAGILHLPPLLMIIFAAVGKMGRNAILLAVGLLVLISLQSGLPDMGKAVAWLHPIVALVIWYLAHIAMRLGRALTPPADPVTAPA